MNHLNTEMLNFNNAIDVVSSAQKFIIPIPKCHGEPLVYPEDVLKDGAVKFKAGDPITDWQGKPIGSEGFVFKNAKDNAWQAVLTDGQGVIICNNVTQQQADAITFEIDDIGRNPDNWSINGIKQLVATIHSIGVDDTYNSDKAFVASKMQRMEATNTFNPGTTIGLFRRDDRDVCQAIFVEGPGSFQGPAATPQEFGTQGAFIIKQGDSVRVVQPNIFMDTYRNKDGSAITAAVKNTNDMNFG